METVLRVWSRITEPGCRKGFSGRLRFAITPTLLIDLAAILPFWISIGITMLSTPMAILGSGFVEEMERKRAPKAPWSCCGEGIPRHR